MVFYENKLFHTHIRVNSDSVFKLILNYEVHFKLFTRNGIKARTKIILHQCKSIN